MTAHLFWGRARWFVAGGWLALHLAASATPALSFHADDAYSGAELMIAGAFAVFEGQLGWYANLVVPAAVGLLIARRYRAAAVCAAVALLIALDTLWLFRHPVPLDEGGSPYLLHALGIGFYLWVGGMVLLLVASVAAHVSTRGAVGPVRQRPAPPGGVGPRSR
ncbi:hypothetical protein R8Z50_25240 [Longispora sp. K20-0274]|uniref:hypothetical protein n=1 Tax=Longispora sp. K20-0274 TaxID=3088255 RepID=UPI00399BBC80